MSKNTRKPIVSIPNAVAPAQAGMNFPMRCKMIRALGWCSSGNQESIAPKTGRGFMSITYEVKGSNVTNKSYLTEQPKTGLQPIPKRLRIYFLYDRKLLAKLSIYAWKVMNAYLLSVDFENDRGL